MSGIQTRSTTDFIAAASTSAGGSDAPPLPMDPILVRNVSLNDEMDPLSPQLSAQPAPMSSPMGSPGATSDFDLEVGAVNQQAVSAAPAESRVGSTANTRTSTPTNSGVAQAQAVAHSMSSLLFGSPGEEQLDDDYFLNGKSASLRLSDDRAHHRLGVAPAQSTSLVSKPAVNRQWHLVSVAELLGHQTPVTALTLHRDGSSFYSGDANGNLLHFTLAGADSAAFACACKQ